MATLQVQARALGDPTRHEIFRHIADAADGVGVAELTAELGLNHNAIRQHLAKLVDARLVVEGTDAPAGRGRPRLRYRLDPSAGSRWGVTGPYERLASMLTEVLRSGESPEDVGQRIGRSRPLDQSAGADPLMTLVGDMARQGFMPTVRSDNGDRAEITLEECPFASAVLTDAETVCALHLGLARGVAESIGDIEVTELRANDPMQAHCRLRCRVDPQARVSQQEA